MDRKQRFFIYLAAIFVAALLTGDFIGGKFFSLFGWTFSSGILAFPLTFVLTDLVNEFYGIHGARRLTYAGLGAALFVFTVMQIALHLPDAETSPIPASVFQNAFGISSRLYVASLTAYMIGQLMDITIFNAVRRITGHRFIWLRAQGSTVLSQIVDSFTVSFVFLVGSQPMDFIIKNAASNYLAKLAMAILLTPLLYGVHGIARRYFGIPERDAPATV